MVLSAHQDAYGQAMLDHLEGKTGFEIVERDDKWIGMSLGPPAYFTEYEAWPKIQQEAIEYAGNKVLDIGCGAGRHSLFLQNQGKTVLGIDISPKAIEVCKRRGLKRAEIVSITSLNPKFGIYGTILMLGNNFGLMANRKRARWLLKRFHKFTPPDGLIIAESRNPFATNDPDHLSYHKKNTSAGKMAGQIRIRVRYKLLVTPWFEYLMVSQEEMEDILHGTGWSVKRFIGDKSPMYVAIIGKG